MKNLRTLKIENSHIYLAVILALAIYLRFSNLAWETVIYDEVPIIKSAEVYTRGDFVTQGFIAFDVPPMMKYMAALSLYFLGFSEAGIRIFSAVFGVLTSVLIYIFAKKYYDQKTALLAAGLVSFSILHITMSRYMETVVPAGFFYLLSLYFLLQFDNKRSYIFLGASLALGMLTKYILLYAIVTTIIYFVIKKYISLNLRPRFTISIDNRVLKTFLVGVVIFLLLWPFFLYPLNVNVSLDVSGRTRDFTTMIPLGFMTFGDVAKSATIGERPDVGLRSFPILGYFLLFLAKENTVFVVLFFTGLFAMYKKRRPADKFIALFIVTFFILLFLQNWGYTFRYIPVITPMLAIVAARSTEFMRKSYFIIFAVAILAFLYAIQFAPHYVLHYNTLDNAFHFSEDTNLVNFFSEGMKETIYYAKENCTKLMTYYEYFMDDIYVPENFTTSSNSLDELPACVMDSSNKYIPRFSEVLSTASCTLKKISYVNGKEFFRIYYCDKAA